jgi:hypothetical protein
MWTGRGLGAGAALLAAWLGAITPGGAATTPGLLRAGDIPVAVQAAGAPTFSTTFDEPLTADGLCTETPTAISGLNSALTAQFSVDGTSTSPSITESVLTLPSAGIAKILFAERVKNEAVRLKCKSVGSIPLFATAPDRTIQYKKLNLATVGSGLIADTSRTTPAGGAPPATVTFYSGRNVVFLEFPGGSLPLTTKQMQTVVTRAFQRLGASN